MLLLIVLLSGVTLVVGAIGYRDIGTLTQDAEEVQRSGREAMQGVRINKTILTMNRAEFRLVSEPTEERLREVQQAVVDYRGQFETQIGELKRAADAEQRALIGDVERAFASYVPQAENTLRVVQKDMSSLTVSDARKEIIASASASRELATKVEQALIALNNYADKQAERLAKEAEASAGHTRSLMLVIVCGGVLGGCLIGYLLSTFAISRPLTRSVDNLRALADGDLSVDIFGVDRKDEIGQIAAALQVFKDNLLKTKHLEEEAVAQKQRTEQERRQAMLELASQFKSGVGSIVTNVTTQASELQVTAQSMAAASSKPLASRRRWRRRRRKRHRMSTRLPPRPRNSRRRCRKLRNGSASPPR